jgi:hypothetical protein
VFIELRNEICEFVLYEYASDKLLQVTSFRQKNKTAEDKPLEPFSNLYCAKRTQIHDCASRLLMVCSFDFAETNLD